MTDLDSKASADPGAALRSGAPEGGQVRTGVASVDGALASLDGLEQRPVSEHPEVFEEVHRRLRDALDGEPEA